jgi:amidase
MKFEEYRQYDATALAELVRKGEVTDQQLLELAIARTEAINPKINAIITPVYELAKRQCRSSYEADQMFSGVPFLLKDLLSALAGVPMSSGSKLLRHFVPEHDSTLVRRYRATGINIFGKTNTPEFGLMGVTEPEAFGPTRNPWDTSRTPGGSSGGSAAAVASGIVPMAGAGDGGGSIRIPAACCGLFGLKPSRGRVTAAPDAAENWDGAALEHVLTRSVRDSAAMLDAICGPAPGDPYWIEKPASSFLSAVQAPDGQFRIAFNKRSPLGTAVHSEAEKAVDDAVSKLAALGHHIEEAGPRIDGHGVAECYLTIYFGHVAAQVAHLNQVYGKSTVKRNIEPITRLMAMLGSAVTAEEYVSARLRWNEFGRQMARFHEQYDFYLTPVLAEPPVAIGSLAPSRLERVGIKMVETLKLARPAVRHGWVAQLAQDSLEKMPFTQLANLTGQPAMSVPLYWTSSGLPMGVQFVAPIHAEAALFRLAAQLESAYPWFSRVAP